MIADITQKELDLLKEIAEDRGVEFIVLERNKDNPMINAKIRAMADKIIVDEFAKSKLH